MALKLADLPTTVIPYKIVSENDFTGLLSDVTQGSGILYSLDFKSTAVTANAQVGQSYYVKISLTSSSVIPGTSTPDIMFQITGSTAGTRISIHFPGGISFSALSLWVVDSNADSQTTRTAPNAGVVSFTAVTS